MTTPIQVVATITPAEGKADRVQQVLDQMAKTVLEQEPGVLRYQLHRQVGAKGTPVFVMLETYKDQEAVKVHGATAHMKQLVQAMGKEGLLAKSLDVVRIAPVGGFGARL